MTVSVEPIELPDFGPAGAMPTLTKEIFEARIDASRSRMTADKLDALIVYGDREHNANLAYLTGFDPRFEEAMLILAGSGQPVLAVGNEGLGYASISPLDLKVVLYQEFSLLSQPRDASPTLEALLREAGVGRGRIGVVGWKYAPTPTRLEVPSYLADTLRDIAGDASQVVNAGHIFMDAETGLRVHNELAQLAAFEYAACHTSDAVRAVITNLEPGLTEFELAQRMGMNGMPLSCHLMLSSGDRARMGLPSPTDRVIAHGDPFTTAYGVWGALNCRAGFVVESAAELPPDITDYVDRLVAPYFAGVVEWYETVGIGVPGGAIYEVIERHLGDPFFGVHLNPGHQIHLDEWVNSPIAKDSQTPLRSGMALQVDIIPATGGPYFTTNIEDGIALADEALRAEFASQYPAAWHRIQARRDYMQDVLGIRLKPEVLPFSNLAATLNPFLLRPDLGMVVTRS